MSDFSLGKAERLYSRKAIGFLFEHGQSLYSYPIKAVYKIHTENTEQPAKAAFSVSKRNFKLAVSRNRFKRLMRESYRLNKTTLTSVLHNKKCSISVMFIYSTKEQLDYSTVEKGMGKLLKKLNHAITEI